MFTKQTNKAYTIVLVYVDDMVITGSHDAIITELKSYLSAKFHMKDLGQLSYFLGLEVSRIKDGIFYVRGNIIWTYLQTKMDNCSISQGPFDTKPQAVC